MVKIAEGGCPGLLTAAWTTQLRGLALRAWSQITRQSDQYVGSGLALVGLALSTFFLVTGIGYGAYVYATEVPPGYTRISFGTLKPDEVDQRGGKLIPAEIETLDGAKVFIKGYIRPDSLSVRKNAKEFRRTSYT